MNLVIFQSDAWHALRKWAEDELAKKRKANDAVELTLEQTILLRGEIKWLKRFLDLPNTAARAEGVKPIDI
jgi:hypothetical protein